MELFGVMIGMSVLIWISIAVVVGVLFPAFWLWMLIDAIVREPGGYPGRDNTEKVMWVVLMIVFQPVAALYFFLVWRPGRGVAPAAPPAPAASVPATPAAA